MRDGFIKVAAVTPDIRVADVSFNTEKICQAIDRAAKEGKTGAENSAGEGAGNRRAARRKSGAARTDGFRRDGAPFPGSSGGRLCTEVDLWQKTIPLNGSIPAP